MSPNTTIYIFLPHLKTGGAEQVILNLANSLNSRGYRIRFLLAEATGEFLESISSDIDVIDLGCPRTPLGPESLCALHLANYLRKYPPDILLSAMPTTNITSLIAKSIAGINTKTVVCEHNTPTKHQHYPRRGASFAAKFLYTHADGIVAVSDGVADDLSAFTGIDRSEIRTIYNPVVSESMIKTSKQSVDHLWFNSAETPVILNLGNMRTQKDLPTLIYAFNELQKSRDVRLFLVGDGNVRPNLESLVQELELSDSVTFYGQCTNKEVYKFMGNSDVFALSSKQEGLPTVLIEALACGCPVVSTDCPSGPKEILADGKYGRLVPVGNPSALAKGLAAALDDPNPDSEELRNRARDFSIETAVDSYEKLIYDLLTTD